MFPQSYNDSDELFRIIGNWNMEYVSCELSTVKYCKAYSSVTCELTYKSLWRDHMTLRPRTFG